MNKLSDDATKGLPEGTVTFLFTDIEGSTNLLRQLGEEYMTLLADHHQILRSSFTKWNGREVDTEGDAFFVSFPRATDAVAAVVEAQRAIAEHAWPQGVTVRVRMGLHTGEPWTAQDGYVGLDVHRAARIAHVGHGGQVLLSETTAALLKEGLPDGVTLLALGRHRLKDLAYPERIRQLVVRGLPAEFPPLKSLEALGLEDKFAEEYVRFPEFLDEERVAPQRPVFVGREREMETLESALEMTLSGNGGIFFIAGDAGSGKTALLDAFSHSAEDREPKLLVAQGASNAFTGSGDPYSPFRALLRQLTGDIESAWKSGTVDKERVLRLWSAIPASVHALVEHGPNLLDTLIPSRGLQSRVVGAMPAGARLQGRVKELVGGERPALGSLEQSHLFEEVKDVLAELSKTNPLLLLLDDMQWSDSGSINLLFHLGRELVGTRVMTLCAYRPEEIAQGRDGDQHPLEPVLSELKRIHGDIWIDLNQVQRRHFVNDFVDSEPNCLGNAFRDQLYEHTGGHALFTVELLRDLQERGDLTKDNDGLWIEEADLDWTRLPTRVEGVIEARIGRLEQELRDTLSIAAVEGEDFTAQVIARIQQVHERGLLQTLSRELEKQYQLVKEKDEVQIGARILSRYQFAHALFQRYLYNDLSVGERRVLHGEIGAILEELYSADLEEIAVHLGRHYKIAQDGEKAVPFLIMAGDNARTLYAFKEACQHYEQALDFLRKDGPLDQAAVTLMKLGLTHNQALEFEESRQAYDEGFELWRTHAKLESSQSQTTAPHAYRIIGDKEIDSIRDPAKMLWNRSVIKALYCGLVTNSEDWNIMPDVAESWEIKSDGTEYIFHLRDDVFWSDGIPVTAHDFEFALKRVLNPSTKTAFANMLFDISGAEDYNNGEQKEPDDVGIKALNKHMLAIQLIGPTGYFIQILAQDVCFPVPKHVVQQHGSSWTEPAHIVTNGSYQLDLDQTDSATTLIRNPLYHGQSRGNVQNIISREGLSNEEKYMCYVNNEIEHIDLIDIPDSEKEGARLRFIEDYSSEPLFMTGFLFFNPLLPPFDKREVRLAFVHSVHRGVPAYEGGFISKTCGMIPAGMPGYNPALGYTYDPDRARQLLRDSGYRGGIEMPDITCSINAAFANYANKYADVWREELGIEVNVDINEELFDIPGLAAESNIFMRNWMADYPDPDSFFRVSLSRHSWLWQNDEFTDLVERARRLTDHAERIRLYKEADSILVDEAVIVPLRHGRLQKLIKPWIRNKVAWPWKDVILDPH